MERYSRIYKLSQELYTKGCPILIKAGALLKDNSLGKLLVQLKLKNLDDAEIREVVVDIAAFDAQGAELEGVKGYAYKNLAAKSDEEFAQQTAITLPSNDTARFDVIITKVVFAGGKIWNAEEKAASAAITEEEKKELLVKKQARELSKKRESVKKLLVLPLILAVAGVVFDIVSLIYTYVVMMPGLDKEIRSLNITSQLSNSLLSYVLAFAIPILVIILVKKAVNAKVSKFCMIAAFVVVGIQILAAVIWMVVMMKGNSTIIMNMLLTKVNGYSLIPSLLGLFSGRAILLNLFAVIADGCLIVKNIVSAIILKKVI